MDETPSQHEAVEAVGEALSAVRQSSIAELEVEWEGGSIRIRREPNATAAAPEPTSEPTLAADDRVVVVSEHVGIFHGGAGGQFPSAGAWVTAGTPLGEIETLGITNTLIVPVDGWVDEVLVADGAGVEYGQRLVTFRPGQPPHPEPLVPTSTALDDAS